MSVAEAVAYIKQTYAVEPASARDRKRGWNWVLYIPGAAERMTDLDMVEFARNLRAFG